MDEPRPDKATIAVAVVVIGIAALFLALAVFSLTIPDPLSALTGMLLGFVALTLGGLQFWAVFRRGKKAARGLSTAFFLLCGFFLFGFIANVGEGLLSALKGLGGPLSLQLNALAFVSVVCLIPATINGIAGVMNWRWSRRLDGARFPQLPLSKMRFTLAGLMVTVTIVALLAAVASYLVRAGR